MNRQSFRHSPWSESSRIQKKLNEIINFRGELMTRNQALMKLYDERDKRIRQITEEYEILLSDVTHREPEKIDAKS